MTYLSLLIILYYMVQQIFARLSRLLIIHYIRTYSEHQWTPSNIVMYISLRLIIRYLVINSNHQENYYDTQSAWPRTRRVRRQVKRPSTWDAVSLGIESKKDATACNSMLAQFINMKLIRSYIWKVNDFLSDRGRLLGIEEWMG